MLTHFISSVRHQAFALAALVIITTLAGVNLDLVDSRIGILLVAFGAMLCAAPLIELWYANEKQPALVVAFARQLLTSKDQFRAALRVLNNPASSESAKIQARTDLRDVGVALIGFAEGLDASLREERLQSLFQPPPPRRQVKTPPNAA